MIPQLITTPFLEEHHYCQPYGWAPMLTNAPVSHLPQKQEASSQDPGSRQQGQHQSQKLMLTGAHGLPSTGTTPMPHEQIFQSEKQYRLRRSKRTEHVMWVGNIDLTVTLDELYHLFRQVDNAPLPPSKSAVCSIYMIQSTRCALVNYKTESALVNSVQRFHGMRLRSHPHAPRLACRRKEQCLKEQCLTLLLSNPGGANE